METSLAPPPQPGGAGGYGPDARDRRRHPREARRIAERQPIQLLLTDVVMPIMNGIELAQRVEAASPTTKVLLMSGYVTSAVKTSGRPLVSKPFRTADLLAAIRQLLDARSAFRRPAPPTAPRPGSV
jgi:YesN/AraC family two-component response regulator